MSDAPHQPALSPSNGPARPVVASREDTTTPEMNAGTARLARPVSLFSIVFLFALFAVFLLAIRWFYDPATLAPQNAAAENLTKELEWRGSAGDRRKVLTEQRANDAKQAGSYAWIGDKQAGVVQLPIERAMELTAQKYGAAQQFRQIRDLPNFQERNR